MGIDQDLFRAAMGQLASGITVVTVHVDGEDHGFTASSFTSLSLDPALVLVCVMKDTRSHTLIEQAGHYAVSILAGEQQLLGERFSDSLVVDRFEGLPLQRTTSGARIIPGSLAWVDCKLREVFPGGDHSIFVGEVVAGFASDRNDALVYHDRHWGRFVSAS
jgi:flavin reductase (DIM6/NTAB) family NADH-FMN oxidoreductase RutF